jgi:hypothetical protein
METLVSQVRTALDAVRAHRGKKIFRLRGRTVSTPAHVEQAALLEGMTLEDFALLEAEMPGVAPEKSLRNHSNEEWDAILEDLSEKSLQIADLNEVIEMLEGKLSVASLAASAFAFPGNALELIQQAGGLSKPKAEAVLAALAVSVQEQK